MSRGNSRSGATATATLTIPGMGSDHCAGIVRTSLERLDGVQDIQTSIAAHRARVRYDAGRLKPADLRAAVERAGYEVEDVGGVGGTREVRLTVPGMGSDHCAGIGAPPAGDRQARYQYRQSPAARVL